MKASLHHKMFTRLMNQKNSIELEKVSFVRNI